MNSVEYDYVGYEACKIKADPHSTKIDTMFDFRDEHQRQKAIEYIRERYESSDEVIISIMENYGKEYVVPAKPAQPEITSTTGFKISAKPAQPERVEIRSFLDALYLSASKPAQIDKTSLLKNGLCRDYAPFANKVLHELGIEACSTNGENVATGVTHIWNTFIGSNGIPLEYDFTYAIFARDGYEYEGFTPPVVPADWLGITHEKMLSNQPNRIITKINGVEIKPHISTESFKLQRQIETDKAPT